MGNVFIDKLNGFARLTAADEAALQAATVDSQRYPAKTDLIREGDQPGPVLVVLEGWVARYKILPSGSRQIVAFLIPGDCCDLHIGMLSEMDHSIQTITPARVATISRADMDSMFNAHPNIARAMYISQLVDEGILRSWIVSMGRRSSLERLAHLICELYLRAIKTGMAQEGVVELPLSQLVMADALGMTPVHINRILRGLRATGAMDLHRGRLVISSPQKLIQIAGFDDNYLHRRLRQGAKYH